MSGILETLQCNILKSSCTLFVFSSAEALYMETDLIIIKLMEVGFCDSRKNHQDKCFQLLRG